MKKNTSFITIIWSIIHKSQVEHNEKPEKTKIRKIKKFARLVDSLNLEDKEKTKIRKIKIFKIFKIWKIKKFKIFARGAWPPVLKTRKTKILITLFSRLWNPCSTRSKHGNRCHGHKKTQSADQLVVFIMVILQTTCCALRESIRFLFNDLFSHLKTTGNTHHGFWFSPPWNPV